MRTSITYVARLWIFFRYSLKKDDPSLTSLLKYLWFGIVLFFIFLDGVHAWIDSCLLCSIFPYFWYINDVTIIWVQCSLCLSQVLCPFFSGFHFAHKKPKINSFSLYICNLFLLSIALQNFLLIHLFYQYLYIYIYIIKIYVSYPSKWECGKIFNL